MARIRINTGSRTEEKPYMVLICIFCKIGEQNTCIYASEICAEGIFCVFSLATKKCEKSKYPFFQMSAILKSDFQKKRKQLHISEENYLNNTKKTQFFM